jgi:ribosomal protein S18 acetylase RimI-like enzyme
LVGVKFIIREASVKDAEGKGYVHYQSWKETYTGLIDQKFLDTRTLEKSVAAARKYPENTFVAEVDNQIVGFSCYWTTREDEPDVGEVGAIYVLKKYYGYGIGKRLMETCFEIMSEYPKIVVWVLDTNAHAIDFYKHIGFVIDGNKKEVPVGNITTLKEIRLTIQNPYYKK